MWNHVTHLQELRCQKHKVALSEVLLVGQNSPQNATREFFTTQNGTFPTRSRRRQLTRDQVEAFSFLGYFDNFLQGGIL